MSKFKVEQYIRMLEETIDKIEEEKHNYNSDTRIRLEVQVSSIMAMRNDLCRIFSIKPRLIGEDKKVAIAKTPHERLLDLGFEHSKYTNYNTYKNDYITIDINTLRKGYDAHSAKNEMNYINLELAEILVDYLKELQD